jgi:hypothetical protein
MNYVIKNRYILFNTFEKFSDEFIHCYTRGYDEFVKENLQYFSIYGILICKKTVCLEGNDEKHDDVKRKSVIGF